ncbi:bifunctional DNA primase/polymerase [Lactobacillus kitasatonis]|uniref:bifunctional DNA primase/polymerase n=1 Tax=Lactobacillus kitasatonis TaxID=237446 RepID=UPI003F6661CC
MNEDTKKELTGETANSDKTSSNEKSLSSTTYSSTKEAAMQYARKGLSVVPLVPQGKIPAIKHADMPRLTVDDVESYWDAHPSANIALKTDRFFCIDVDMHGDENGKASIDALGHPEWFNKTYCEKTPHDGLHYYFAIPDGIIIRQMIGWKKGVDIRAGENGTVTVTPSIGDNGKIYQPLNHNPMLKPDPALLRMILEDENKQYSNIIMNADNRYGSNGYQSGQITKTGQAITMITHGLGDKGLRNCNLAFFVGILLWNCVDINTIASLALAANKNTPDPLPLHEVKTTLNSIYARHIRQELANKKKDNQ